MPEVFEKYLADETARCRIVESAHSFVTRELTLERSVRRVLTLAAERHPERMNASPLIINAALTGMVPNKADNPNVPITPEEIADDARRCVDAGAAIVHVHARDDQGRPTYKVDVYREIVAAVRERCPDVIVCASTSGRVFGEFEQRAEVLDLDGELKPGSPR